MPSGIKRECSADNNILLSLKNYDDIEDKKNWSNVAEAAEDVTDLTWTAPPEKMPDAGVKGLKALTTVKMTTTGSLKAKNLYAKTPAEAASLLAHIRKSPQENLYVVPVDKKGKVTNSSLKRSELGDIEVESCLVDTFRQLEVPATKGEGISIVSYPFVPHEEGRPARPTE